jgi:GT2 family glycosyltransferase
MPIHVASVELDDLEGASIPDDAGTVYLLVRWQGVPLGIARVAAMDAHRPGRLRQEIAAQVELPPEPPPRSTTAAPMTIVVCTRERPRDLTRCLDALRPLLSDGHDVLVVDNAPDTNRTAGVVSRYSVRHVVEPKPGLNNARNRGLAEARHDIVAYVDDDATVDRSWADAIAEPFARPEVASVTGLVLPFELRTEAQQRFEAYSAHRRTFTTREFTRATLAPAAAGVAGVGANMAFRRAAVERLGGFDPRLDAGTRTRAGGDNDMFARILDAGHTIVYTPRALVWHRHRETERELRECVFGYGVGVFAFLTKRVIEAHDLGALVTGGRWLVGPFVRTARQRASGADTPPAALLLREAAGALLGPFRFFSERRAHHAIRHEQR